MDSYRVEIQAVHKIQLTDDNAEIDPILISGGSKKAEPELYRLSNIINAFNLLSRKNSRLGKVYRQTGTPQRFLASLHPVKTSFLCKYFNNPLDSPALQNRSNEKYSYNSAIFDDTRFP